MVLIIDVEATTFQTGNPFSKPNKACAIGYYDGKGTPVILKIEYDEEPYGDALRTLQIQIDNSDLLVGFNLKYDLHWLRRYGIKFQHKPLWDCQIGYFNLSGHTEPYPSLNDLAAKYGLPPKLDVVKTEYWDKGIDTTEVPWDTLYEYLKQDLVLTFQGYQAQLKDLSDKPKMKKLIEIACADTLVLQEMEWNGLLLDTPQANKLAAECEARLQEIDTQLTAAVGVANINWSSGQQVSAVLYGGTIPHTVRESYEFVYKDGRTAIKERNIIREHRFVGMVRPLKGTKLKKEGIYQTGADILADLRATGKAKRIIRLLIERHDLAKLSGTYYQGLPKLIKEMQWEDNTIHGNLNQCVAVTGRLTSTKPNLQNNPPQVDLLFRSRYAD